MPSWCSVPAISTSGASSWPAAGCARCPSRSTPRPSLACCPICACAGLIDLQCTAVNSRPPPTAAELLSLWREQTRDHALLLLDTDGEVVDAFGSVVETLGYAPHELAGRPLAHIFTPED